MCRPRVCGLLFQIWCIVPPPSRPSRRTRARTPARPSQHAGLRRWCPRPSAWSMEERRTSCRLFARDPLTVGPLCAETRQDLQTVRQPQPRSYSLSLNRILPELAMRCLYGDLEGQETIVMPWNTAFIPVPSAAPIWSAQERAYEQKRSSFATESTSRHRGVLTVIGAEVASTLAVVFCP